MIKHVSILILLSAGALSGCALSGAKYACPHPNGVTCMSAPDVYRATNNADEVVGVDPKQAAKAAREGHSAGKVVSPGPAPEGKEIEVPVPTSSSAQMSSPRPRPALGVAVDGDTLALTDTSLPTVTRAAFTTTNTPAPSYPTLPEINVTGAEPYRVPAKIMRIFIKPWEDEGGDLHMGGYIFSEIETRKWTQTAHTLKADARVFQLMDAPKKDAAQDAAPLGNVVATPQSPPQGVVAPNHNQQKGNSQ